MSQPVVITRSTVFIRQPEDSTTGVSTRVWREKYAVLTSCYWAYYESGTQYQRHRGRPVVKISVSSLLEIKTLPDMKEGKHAIQIIWSNDRAVREEIFLGFHHQGQQMKWSNHLEEQIKEGQSLLTVPEETYVNDELLHDAAYENEVYCDPIRALNNQPDDDIYECTLVEMDHMPSHQPDGQGVLSSGGVEKEVSRRGPIPAPRVKLRVNAKETNSRLLLRSEEHSSLQQPKELHTTEPNEERVGGSLSEIIKNVGKLRKGMIVYAIHAHQAIEDDELSFDQGGVIEVIHDAGPEDCWCQGRLRSTLEEGLFPVNFVDTTSLDQGIPEKEDILYDDSVWSQFNPDESDHICRSKHEQEDGSVTAMMPEELQQGMRDIQRNLLDHVETLSRMIAIHDYDETMVSKKIADIDTSQRLREELSCLSQRQERTKKRLDQAIIERNLCQSKLKAAEDKIESLQSVLEKALGDNVDQGKKLAQLEQHQTLLNIRTSERDESRYFLAESERLNANLCDEIITLSQEVSKTKLAHARALEEKEKTLMAAKLAMNDEKQRKEMLGRRLTVTTKSYKDRLSKSETQVSQLKERVIDLEKQTSKETTELTDLRKQLAAAKEELDKTTDSERQLGRQLGRLSDDFEAMEKKYETEKEQKSIAEEELEAAKTETSQLRENLERATKAQTRPASTAGEDQQDVMERLQLRVKELEEINSHLEELQVLSETRASKK